VSKVVVCGVPEREEMGRGFVVPSKTLEPPSLEHSQNDFRSIPRSAPKGIITTVRERSINRTVRITKGDPPA
jgi:hypothetical protein